MIRSGSFTRGVNYRKLSEKYVSLLLLLFLTPLVFLILGAIVSSSPNHRPELIRTYNGRTELWLNKVYHFVNSIFYLNETMFAIEQFSSGHFFPVSDACNRTEDPRYGCMYTPTKFFNSQIASDRIVHFSILDGNSTVIKEEKMETIQMDILNKKALGCATARDCNELCSKKHGSWNVGKGYCNITRYLNSICYRLELHTTRYILDSSDLVDSNNEGCYYSNEWSPYSFSNEPSSSIHINLRLNYDPVISASLLTSGCSDSHLSNSTTACCFGAAHEDQRIMARILFITGLGVFITEIISVSAVCFLWVGKKRHVSPSRVLSPSYEQIFTPLMYAETHPLELPDELAGLGTQGLQERLAVNGTLRVPKPNFSDSSPGPVEILEFFLFFVITSCYCWHNIGHAMILQIAINQVNHARKNRVKTLLEGLEENHLNMTDMYSAACWADSIKKTTEFKETWKWHVIDYHANSTFPYSNQNAVDKLYQLMKTTNLYSLSNDNLMNLRYLVHIAADLHQPFHAYASYNYASSVTVNYKGKRENLHFFTDRVADGLLNPIDLPLSLQMEQYVQECAQSIAALCSMEKDVSYELIQRWAYQSFSLAEELLSMVTEELSEEAVSKMQRELMIQICVAGNHLGIIMNELPMKWDRNWSIIIVMSLVSVVLCNLYLVQYKRVSEEEEPLLKKG